MREFDRGDAVQVIYSVLSNMEKASKVVFSEKAKERIRDFLGPFAKNETLWYRGFGFH